MGAVTSPVGAHSDCPHKLYVDRWHSDKHISLAHLSPQGRTMQMGRGTAMREANEEGATETEGLDYYNMTPCYGQSQSGVGTLQFRQLGGPRHSREGKHNCIKETPCMPNTLLGTQSLHAHGAPFQMALGQAHMPCAGPLVQHGAGQTQCAADRRGARLKC